MSDHALSRRLREASEAAVPGSTSEAVPAEDEAPEPPAQCRRRPLGELLVAKGLISSDALEDALEQQRRDGRPLGQILLAAGLLTPQSLARTLTEQHGFDFSGSLRERLATGQGDARPEDAAPEIFDLDQAEVGGSGETYFLYEAGVTEPLHVATSFLDAADAAFELIDDRRPEKLEIVRVRDSRREQLWSYRREAVGFPPEPPSPS